MAGLTGKTIAATYHSILKVSTSDNQNLDDTLRDIVDGEDTASCLKLATDKATFTLGTDSGDDFKIYNGTTNIITVEGDNGTVTLDKDFTGTTTATTNGLVIDFDATGITASGQTATNIGLDLDLNSDSPTMVGTVNNTGIDVLLTAATSGTQKNIGMNIAVTGADTNYALIASGGNVGINDTAPDNQLHVTNSDGVTKEVVKLEQLDADEPFILFTGTTASDQTKSLSTDTSVGSIEGHILVSINGADKWIAYYAKN